MVERKVQREKYQPTPQPRCSHQGLFQFSQHIQGMHNSLTSYLRDVWETLHCEESGNKVVSVLLKVTLL